MKNLRITRLNLKNKIANSISNPFLFGNKIQKTGMELAIFNNKIN